MLRPILRTVLAATLVVSAAPAASAAVNATTIKWPPWLSIESPVNPFDAGHRGAVFLVHAMMREKVPGLDDLTASAEGMVNGERRTVALRIDATAQPGVFAVRRQWPTTGSWLVRVTLARSTTALVTLDNDGSVASIRVPTRNVADQSLPRPVAAREIDSVLTTLAAQHP